MVVMVVQKDLNKTDNINRSSNKSFGVVFSIIFMVVGFWPLTNNQDPRLWALVISIGLFSIAFIKPNLLAKLNLAWFKFGQLLHKIMNPIILALIFFLTIMPIGLMMQLCGKRPIPLSFDKTKESYWIDKTPVGPEPDTMKRQF